ncbi:MAG: hypothetical protein IPL26_16830 [Leptospiraceae bacterium]|nr:hypothetical protein [Leptospiraceae bacterium]
MNEEDIKAYLEKWIGVKLDLNAWRDIFREKFVYEYFLREALGMASGNENIEYIATEALHEATRNLIKAERIIHTNVSGFIYTAIYNSFLKIVKKDKKQNETKNIENIEIADTKKNKSSSAEREFSRRESIIKEFLEKPIYLPKDVYEDNPHLYEIDSSVFDLLISSIKTMSDASQRALKFHLFIKIDRNEFCNYAGINYNTFSTQLNKAKLELKEILDQQGFNKGDLYEN